MIDYIPKLVTEGQNNFLMWLPTKDEIKQYIWSMPIHAAPGRDGYAIVFFRECWEIIANDIMDANK